MAEVESGSVADLLIATTAVSLELGGRKILDAIDFSISAGEIVTLVGPNGAGKSTLVRVLLGLLMPSSGDVKRCSNLLIGYVPQRFPVPETLPLSVERLLTLTMRAKRGDLERVLEETGIAHLKQVPVAALSGGELQRALIAKALLREPNLLVMDEPVQGVDFIGEANLYRLIGDIRRQRGCGILMVSHDLHVVMAESDRVICLNGHVCCQGQPESVKADPEFARMFGPDAARVMTIYAHEHDHTHDGDHVHPVGGCDHDHTGH